MWVQSCSPAAVAVYNLVVTPLVQCSTCNSSSSAYSDTTCIAGFGFQKRHLIQLIILSHSRRLSSSSKVPSTSHVPSTSNVPSTHHIPEDVLNASITSKEKAAMSRIDKSTIGDALKNPSRFPTSSHQGRARAAAKPNEVNGAHSIEPLPERECVLTCFLLIFFSPFPYQKLQIGRIN